ncbi:MAG: GNAT family N-acetyltransferase [Actinomycetota bacterium]
MSTGRTGIGPGPAAHLRLGPASIESAEGSALAHAQWRELLRRYRVPEDRQGVTDGLAADHLAPPDGVFLVGWVDDTPVACGGLRRHDATTAEIKRMYVVPEHRGCGYSRLVLRELEAQARARGYTGMVLETGVEQPEAVALYESEGYTRIAGYGFSRDNPSAWSYGKALAPDGPGQAGSKRTGSASGPRNARP